ncbi:HTH-type transcriptional regulator PksA [Tersicoccus solisilvae]|uniref:HTH-type transcriptional regulator PksA n=1 Tax=Tersicoccus solisilvae TaxID=1882339 RepID=A0ABQ1NXI3_9MICC|nr:TetR/AcrR family transcriptional regulator [Tersicoccus solisilvae]GGC85024.1 HTH-type transcriptional regulator PksA [Tersicoccus solisilvae]
MPRRIDTDARKAQLARAVWQVILDRGIGAVSVRTVADEASVAVGSLRHVFPTRAELLEFSAALMVQRARDRIRQLPPVEDPQQYALEVIRQLLPLTPDSRAELEVNIALIAETPALPELAGIRDDAYHQLGEACHAVVGLLTHRPRGPWTEQQARRLHAVIDGLAIHLLMADPADGDGWAMDIVRDELAALARVGADPEAGEAGTMNRAPSDPGD